MAGQRSSDNQKDPSKHWTYRVISALCGGLIGTGIGAAILFLIGTEWIPLALVVVGALTFIGAIIGYRFPYAPDVLHVVAHFLK